MPLPRPPRRWLRLAAAVTATAGALPLQGAGPPVERTLSGGDRSVHEVHLDPGSRTRLVVEQEGVDVVVEVYGPGGVAILSIDAPLGRWSTESALLPASATGLHRIEVRPLWDGVGRGRFRLRLETGRLDRPELEAAEEAWTRGARVFARTHAAAAPAELLQDALTVFREAGDRFRDLDLPGREAAARHAQGAVSRRLGRSGDGVDLLRRAAALWRSAGDDRMEAEAWNDLGLALWESGDLDEADRSFERALARLRELGDPAGEADAAQNRCLVIHARGDLGRAVACYQEARDRFRRLGERRWKATALNNLGYAYYGLGEPAPAIASYREALELRSDAGDRAGEAQTLNNLAVVHRRLGDLQEALSLYDRARRLQHDLGDRRDEAATLSNLGVIYRLLGEPGRARTYFEQALELRRALEDPRGRISTLNHLGGLLCEQGESAQALALHRQAVELAESSGGVRDEAQSLARLGQCLARSGRPVSAEPLLEAAVRRFGETGDRVQQASARHDLAEVELDLGRPAAARTALQEALAARLETRDAVGVAVTRATLARALEAEGELSKARAQAEAALEAIESLRRQIASQGLRATFLGAEREAYEVLLAVLAALHRREPDGGFEHAAFEVSEQARARVLLDVLHAAGRGPAPRGDPDLVARRRSLRRRLHLKAERRLAPRGPGPGPDELELETTEILRELDAVEGRMRREDPRYAALVETVVPDLAEIQEVLGPETVLLEYFLGDSRGFLWAIDSGGITFHEIPRVRELAARARRVHERWSAPPTGGDRGLDAQALALSRVLLGPVWRDLSRSSGARRLAVAADGALHLVPFAALPRPDEPGEPLLTRFEVVQVPSAAVLSLQHRRRARRTEAPGPALILADPVFDPRDERVRPGPRPAPPRRPAAPGAAPRVAPDRIELDRMRFSREEAEGIEALDPDRVDLRLDFGARREALLDAAEGNFEVVHVASHARVDTEHPALSGLVLSRVDRHGRPVDGWLRLADVYDLELGADLVVLSGCRTALGRQVGGAGLLGLARGFLHAGARSVVASLWAVQDRATAELMATYYRKLWSEGLAPGAALRAAQLELRRKHRWRAPFYWAPWTFTGGWRPADQVPDTSDERSSP